MSCRRKKLYLFLPFVIILLLLIAFLAVTMKTNEEEYFGSTNNVHLSLQDVFLMRLEKGSQIAWEDLDKYFYIDESTNPFLRYRYPIDEKYSLLISGSAGDERPALTYLVYGEFDEEHIPFTLLGCELDGEIIHDGIAQCTNGNDYVSANSEVSLFLEEMKNNSYYVPVNVIREPVTLFVGNASHCIEAPCFSRCWTYDISKFTGTGNIGGGYSVRHPLQCKDLVHDNLNTENQMVSLLFSVDTQPDDVEVICYPEYSWGNDQICGETLQVAKNEHFSFNMKEGRWIYHIAATWKHKDKPENYEGTANYIFTGNLTK